MGLVLGARQADDSNPLNMDFVLPVASTASLSSSDSISALQPGDKDTLQTSGYCRAILK